MDMNLLIPYCEIWAMELDLKAGVRMVPKDVPLFFLPMALEHVALDAMAMSAYKSNVTVSTLRSRCSISC